MPCCKTRGLLRPDQCSRFSYDKTRGRTQMFSPETTKDYWTIMASRITIPIHETVRFIRIPLSDTDSTHSEKFATLSRVTSR